MKQLFFLLTIMSSTIAFNLDISLVSLATNLTQIVGNENSDSDLENFLKEYAIPEMCGPDYKKPTPQQDASEEEWNTFSKKEINSELACILIGSKPLALEYPSNWKFIDKRLFSEKNELKYGLHVIQFTFKEEYKGSEYFVYKTQDGKKRAELMNQYNHEAEKNENPWNHYLRGILLGYSEADIKYYYLETFLPGYYKNPQESFEQDKRAAKEWLEKNNATDLAKIII